MKEYRFNLNNLLSNIFLLLNNFRSYLQDDITFTSYKTELPLYLSKVPSSMITHKMFLLIWIYANKDSNGL